MLLKGSAKDLGHSMQEIDHRTKKGWPEHMDTVPEFPGGSRLGGSFLGLHSPLLRLRMLAATTSFLTISSAQFFCPE